MGPESGKLSDPAVRDWAEYVQKTLYSGRGKFRNRMLKRYVVYDVIPALLSFPAVILAWYLLYDWKALASDNGNLYLSLFQGFSAFVALMFAFVTFIYVRGERQTGELVQKAAPSLRSRLPKSELNNEIEARIWLYLWNKVRTEIGDPEREKREFRRVARTIGMALRENEIISSLPWRSLLLIALFGFLIIGALFSLAGIITSSLWTAILVLLSVFSIVWFASFAIRVLCGINEQSEESSRRQLSQSRRPMFSRKGFNPDHEPVLTSKEKKAIKAEFDVDLDEFPKSDILPFVRPEQDAERVQWVPPRGKRP